jgi:hypothetical protein
MKMTQMLALSDLHNANYILPTFCNHPKCLCCEGSILVASLRVILARLGQKRNAYRLLVGKPREKPLGRPKRRWLDNIRMDLGEVGWGDVDWIGLAQDRNRWRALVNSVLNLRFA